MVSRARFVVLIVAALALSGQSPKQNAKPASDQQTKPAQQPAPLAQQPASRASEQRRCPGTRFPNASCEAITAEATMRQVDIAADQANVAYWNNWISVFTGFVAGLAAWFASRAASAATKSYKAFVAAEDAHLAIEFPNGTFGESYVDGVRTAVSYHLTAVITNIGRSTARVHDCTVRDHMVNVEKTLKPNDSETLGWSIMIDSLDQFAMVIRYTSPIRTNAMLMVQAIPQKTNGRSGVIANVVSSYIIDDD